MEGEALTGLPVMRYQSENFILDTDDYSLTRNGVSHPIEPQVFDLLVYLIENRNRVVTREELLDQLWNGRIVSDSAINARLKEARKAVGDNGKDQRVIKTIHRRGYQFIADVNVTSGDDRENEGQTTRPPSKSGKPSIAVLRFTNLSNDPEQLYFSDGMATNICSRLSRIQSLQVKSGIEYDLGKISLTDIARELEVKYVLSGSVQRESDRARVFVDLMDGISGEIIWSEHFDRLGRDVIDIQDEIATTITAKLWNKQGVILEAERERLEAKPTADFSAFDYILKGRYYKEEFTREALELARGCFDKAIELDPNSSEAWAWRAWVNLLEIDLGCTNDIAESVNKAFIAARKSISKGSYSELGHWALGEAYMLDQDTQRGFVEIEKALEINPNNPDLVVIKGYFQCFLGQFDEGIEMIHQGINFNRRCPEWYFWNLGIAYFVGHQFDSAIDAFTHMENQNKSTLTYLVASYVQVGDLVSAEKSMRELFDTYPELSLKEIAESHSHLAAQTQKLLIDSIKLVLDKSKPPKKLRVVKS
jgi:TolB-like protein/Tfp pilus assembly protein PilF